uniref:Transforming growth factor, alpha n=1 Tax=Oryzias sinensis TaxID=183150 RepID=A0A8C7X1Z0_9TELE
SIVSVAQSQDDSGMSFFPCCRCHPGFVGLRCEHADLLAVVATNHRQQTVATVLVLCVVGCVLIMVLSNELQWLESLLCPGAAGRPSESGTFFLI